MKKKLFSLLEVTVWVGIFFGIIFFIMSCFHPDLDIKKTYTVYFRDVNGLIVGSPVRFMGYDIGHVSKIDVLKDKIKLTLAITQPNCKLPKASSVTIEAASLGGARSLELFPSANLFQSEKISAVEPKRINEILLSSTEFTESLGDGMTSMARILEVVLDSEEYKKIDEINESLAQLDDDLYNLSDLLVEKQKASSAFLGELKDNLELYQEHFSQFNLDKKRIIAKAKSLQDELNALNKSLSNVSAKKLKKVSYDMYKKTENVKMASKEELKRRVKSMMCGLCSLQEFIDSANSSLTSGGLANARKKMQEIKQLSNEINKHVKEEK